MDKGKYIFLVKNTFLFMVSTFGSKLLNFVLVPLYTYVLSTEDYGIADVALTTSNLLIFIVTLNIADAVLRFSIDRSDRQDEILGYGIKVILKGNAAFCVALCLFAFINPINWEGYLYVFLFINVFINSFSLISNNYLRAVNKIKDVAIASIIATAVTIFCNIVTLLFLKIGIYGYLISITAGPLSSAIYCLYKCGNLTNIIKSSTNDRAIKVAMFSYSLPLILNGIAWWINSSIDKYFIIIYGGASDNGIYAISQKIPTILTTFSTIFLQAWNLSAIKEFNNEDEDFFFSNTYNVVCGGLVIICSGIIIFNIPLAKILYAKEFFVAWQCSSWLVISVLFSSLSSFMGSIFSATKDSRIFSISTVISAVVNIVLNMILIPSFGNIGAAIATTFSFFLIWYIRYVCVRKYMKLKVNMWENLFLFFLLFIQLIFEHQETHFYKGQIAIFVIIVLKYKKSIFYLLGVTCSVIKGKSINK